MRGDGSIHSLQSRQELARFFQGVADTYQKDGYAGGRFDEFQVSPIGGRSALATLNRVMLRRDGSFIRKQHTDRTCLDAAQGRIPVPGAKWARCGDRFGLR